VKLYK